MPELTRHPSPAPIDRSPCDPYTVLGNCDSRLNLKLSTRRRYFSFLLCSIYCCCLMFKILWSSTIILCTGNMFHGLRNQLSLFELRTWPTRTALNWKMSSRGWWLGFSPLRPVKAWAKNSERSPAMIYSDLFSLLFCKCLAVFGVSESLQRVSFEMPAFLLHRILVLTHYQFNKGQGDNYKSLWKSRVDLAC